MEKKEMMKHANVKMHVQHAVQEKQIMTDMRHPNIVQVRSPAPCASVLGRGS
jgi:hypothetical protein